MSDIEKKGSSASDVAYQLEALDPREKAERIAASFVPPTPEEERKVIRKLDRRLLPLVFVLYSLAVLDRSNLGNARLAGLTKSIDLSGNRCTYHCCQTRCDAWVSGSPKDGVLLYSDSRAGDDTAAVWRPVLVDWSFQTVEC